MKIVLAEKVSPATLAILQREQGWNVITADQIAPGGLPAELADADALIVGGYGRSRALEFVLGGVTRELIGHQQVPVILVH